MDFFKYETYIRDKLTDKRYHHSVCVAEEAWRLALLYGADAETAYLAGLLHDIAKEMKKREQLQKMAEFGIILDTVEKNVPKLWHARLGAILIEREFSVNDPALLNAVRYHTTARAGMALIEKILYLADFISADRQFDGVEEVRQAAAEGLDAGVRAGLRFTIRAQAADNEPIHVDAIEAYNELCIAQNRKG